MLFYFALAYRTAKYTLGQFKFKPLNKYIKIKNNLKSEIKDIKNNLSKLGYKRIKNFQRQTWKYYSDGGYRITFKAYYSNKKVFIKIGTPSQKIENSIKALELIGNRVDFSPSGERINYPGRSCYKTEFVKSYNFYQLSDYIKRHIDDYIFQAITILNKLNETKTVHCDVETYNLIFRKKDKKMMLIDFDTSNSQVLNLHCDKPPRILIQCTDGNGAVFDDAYSFYTIFKRLLGQHTCDSLKRLENLIGRNFFND